MGDLTRSVQLWGRDSFGSGDPGGPEGGNVGHLGTGGRTQPPPPPPYSDFFFTHYQSSRDFILMMGGRRYLGSYFEKHPARTGLRHDRNPKSSRHLISN